MIICNYAKECDETAFDCIHRRIHSVEDGRQDNCQSIPCGCEWAVINKKDAYCVSGFLSLMQEAIK
jgi:hypothetical protein